MPSITPRTTNGWGMACLQVLDDLLIVLQTITGGIVTCWTSILANHNSTVLVKLQYRFAVATTSISAIPDYIELTFDERAAIGYF
jgi:hypothetical protein